MDNQSLSQDLGYWEQKYWELFTFASQQLGEAFAAACETHQLPTDAQRAH